MAISRQEERSIIREVVEKFINKQQHHTHRVSYTNGRELYIAATNWIRIAWGEYSSEEPREYKLLRLHWIIGATTSATQKRRRELVAKEIASHLSKDEYLSVPITMDLMREGEREPTLVIRRRRMTIESFMDVTGTTQLKELASLTPEALTGGLLKQMEKELYE